MTSHHTKHAYWKKRRVSNLNQELELGANQSQELDTYNVKDTVTALFLLFFNKAEQSTIAYTRNVKHQEHREKDMK